MTDTTSAPLPPTPGPRAADRTDAIPVQPRSYSLPFTTLTGPLTKWVLFDHERRYGTVTLPFSPANEFVMAYVYRGETGKGQQRDVVEAHAKKIAKEMRDGMFTPAAMGASLTPKHREKLKINEADGTFSVEVDRHNPLVSVDGNHRFKALCRLYEELGKELDKATTDEEQAKLLRQIEQVASLPCTFIVYLDGDPAVDFINLQKGKTVDPSHLKSLSMRAGLDKDPAAKLAHEVARLAHKDARSPYHKQVRFDSCGDLALPISTLTAGGSSDLGTSLIGLARVGKGAKRKAAPASELFAALSEVAGEAPAADLDNGSSHMEVPADELPPAPAEAPRDVDQDNVDSPPERGDHDGTPGTMTAAA